MQVDFRWNDSAAKEILQQAGREAQRALAHLILDRARELAPGGEAGEIASSGRAAEDQTAGEIQIEFNSPAAAPTEFGHLTTSGSWVAPRPFFSTAIAEGVAEFPSVVAGMAVGGSGGSG